MVREEWGNCIYTYKWNESVFFIYKEYTTRKNPYLKHQDFTFMREINNSSLFFFCFTVLYQPVQSSIWEI